MGAFFLCITACIIVMRRMSSYMIERSTNLVDRLAVTMEIAHGISSAAEAQHRDNVERLLGQEKGRFHDKLGAVIGSGPKNAHEERLAQTAVKASKGSLRKEVSDGGSSYRYVYVPPAVPNGSSDGLDRGVAPPNGGLAGSGAPPAHAEPNGGCVRTCSERSRQAGPAEDTQVAAVAAIITASCPRHLHRQTAGSSAGARQTASARCRTFAQLCSRRHLLRPRSPLASRRRHGAPACSGCESSTRCSPKA